MPRRRKAKGEELGKGILAPRKHLFCCMAAPLPDDLLPDILLLVPPDEPACLVRAAAVCKAWRRILADPGFLGRYRAFHRTTPPVLGFLHHPRHHEAPRFVPTATSFRLPTHDRHMRHVWGCHHGRVLLFDYDMRSSTYGFLVWDPITGNEHRIPYVPGVYSNAALICTAGSDGDHRGCSRAPFIIAFVGVQFIEHYGLDVYGEFYSSQTGRWADNDNVHLYDAKFDLERDRPAAQVGDSLYFVGTSGILLQFCYGPLLQLGLPGILCAGIRPSETLTLIKPPAKHLGEVIVMTAEGGGLGLACLKHNRVTLWARETKAGLKEDADIWVKRMTVDLKKLIPLANPKRLACLSGMIPGDAKVIFVGTGDGVFRIELEPSLQATKVSDMGTDVNIIYPFVSFYTETLLAKLGLPFSAKWKRQRLATSKLPAPEENL